MNMTRKQFLLSLFGSTAAIFLDACGGGGGSYGASPPPPSPAPGPAAATCGASDGAISGNHAAPHAVSFAKTDVDATTDQTYNIQGMADHNHTITVTAAQLAQLKAGMSVVVTSSITLSHQHDVTITCA